MRTLGREAGTARTQTLTFPAPDDLRLELSIVPAGSDAQLEVRFEAVTEGVLATGSATVPVVGECARCLEPVSSPVTATFQELYYYNDPRSRREQRDERAGLRRSNDEQDAQEGPDSDERFLDGDLLDLEPVLRDAVVLALPMSPLCQQDCPGLCITCGVRLAEAGADHGHDVPDPRWARLQGLHELDGSAEPQERTEQGDRTGTGALDLQEG